MNAAREYLKPGMELWQSQKSDLTPQCFINSLGKISSWILVLRQLPVDPWTRGQVNYPRACFRITLRGSLVLRAVWLNLLLPAPPKTFISPSSLDHFQAGKDKGVWPNNGLADGKVRIEDLL